MWPHSSSHSYYCRMKTQTTISRALSPSTTKENSWRKEASMIHWRITSSKAYRINLTISAHFLTFITLTDSYSKRQEVKINFMKSFKYSFILHDILIFFGKDNKTEISPLVADAKRKEGTWQRKVFSFTKQTLTHLADRWDGVSMGLSKSCSGHQWTQRWKDKHTGTYTHTHFIWQSSHPFI